MGSVRESVVLIDPNKVMVDALSVVIENDPGLSLVASGTNAQDAVLLSRTFQPRVLVLAEACKGAPTPLLISLVCQFSPTTRILVTTTEATLVDHELAENRSVWGVNHLHEGMPKLLAAIHEAANATRRSRAGGRRAPRHTRLNSAPQSAAGLSARELQVLELLAEGDSNAAIASELTISVGTVKRHVANLYGKLGVNTRVAAVRRGASLGLLELSVSNWTDPQEAA